MNWRQLNSAETGRPYRFSADQVIGCIALLLLFIAALEAATRGAFL